MGPIRVVPRKPAFVPVAMAGFADEWGHTESGKGTHLLKIGYSFVDRNVPDRDGGDTPNKECVRDNVTDRFCFRVGGMSSIGMSWIVGFGVS